MSTRSEKNILTMIKFAPSLFIITISILTATVLYFEKKNSFEEDKRYLENEYRQNNKQNIKEQVYRVYNYANKLLVNANEDIKKNLQIDLQRGYSILDNLYRKNINKSEEEIKEIIKDALRTIRFNDGRGYYFIYEYSGESVLHSANPELEGRNLFDFGDDDGKKTFFDVRSVLENRNFAYFTFSWLNPKKNDGVKYEKLGMIAKFKPFNWFIGTGEYVDAHKEIIQKKVLGFIDNISFENNYVYVINSKGDFLSHINPNFQGKNLKNLKNINGYNTLEKIVDVSKKGEGYLTYDGVFDHTKDIIDKKTGFIKSIDELNWIIGTGFYEDELEKIIKQRAEIYDKKFNLYVNNMIVICFVLTLFLLIISFYISQLLEKYFIKYKLEIKKHLQDNTKQQNLLSQQSKMAAMGEMIGNIAHQWRQPLSTITTAATGMKVQKEVGVLNDDLFFNAVDGITDSANFLSKTIDDFRDFFKPDKEKVLSNTTNILKRTINLIKPQYDTRNIKIIQDVQSLDFLVLENELIQVLLNIFNNARDELIKIEDSHAPKFIFVKVYKEKNTLFIKIKDNAGGIPKDIINRVFEPYFTTKHQAQGTGIGLYMSEEIIHKHMNGLLTVENKKYEHEGKKYRGAQFTIELKI